MSNIELVIIFLATFVMAGILGYLFGRDAYLEKNMWTKCIFSGEAPEGYSNWHDFLRSPFKSGVYMRAAKPTDWSHATKERSDE